MVPKIQVTCRYNDDGNMVVKASMPLPDWVRDIDLPAFREAATDSLRERLDATMRAEVRRQIEGTPGPEPRGVFGTSGE